MKTYLLFSVLCLSSISTYGQMTITPHRPSLYTQCEDAVKELSFKFNFHTYASKFCNDTFIAKELIQKRQIIEPCLDLVSKKSTYDDPLLACTNLSIRKSLEGQGYQHCLEVTNKFELGFQQFWKCNNGDSIKLAADPSFNECFEIFKTAYPYNSGVVHFNDCQDKRKIASVIGESFGACRKRITGLGVSTVSAISYCVKKENQRGEHLTEIEDCANNVGDLLPNEGVNFCMSMKGDLKLVTSENVECAKNIKKQYFDKTYFTDENFNKSSDAIEKILVKCQRPDDVKPANARAKFLGLKIVSTNKSVQNTLVGGLSGLVYSEQEKSLLVVSDDPGIRNASRIYKLDAVLESENSFDFLSSMKIITPHVTKDFFGEKKGFSSIDAEGIALLSSGDMVISTETLFKNAENYIRVYGSDGKYKEDVILPSKFLPTNELVEVEETYWGPEEDEDDDKDTQTGGGLFSFSFKGNDYDRNNGIQPSQRPSKPRRTVKKKRIVKKMMQVSGVQTNRSFEALTSVPGKDILFTANEFPLVQDDFRNSKIVRITRLVKDAEGKLSANAEFAYKLDKGEENGLVELVALSETRILTLERRFDFSERRVTARIYEIDLTHAKNYLDVHSFQEEDKREAIIDVRKTLVLDLDDIRTQMPEGFQKIDNFEGMALGPILPNGKRSLILVTDNNFNFDQLTQILTLELNL